MAKPDSKATVILYSRISPELHRKLCEALQREDWGGYRDGHYVRRSMQRLVEDLLTEAIAARSTPAPARSRKLASKTRSASKTSSARKAVRS